MAIHLCGRPEGWAARLSPGEPGIALLFGLAPGRACPFHSVRPKPSGIVTVALVLASRRAGVTRYRALWSSDFPHAVGLPRRRAAIRPSR
jgi:hypothetical protein